jgi:hypothetical protein
MESGGKSKATDWYNIIYHVTTYTLLPEPDSKKCPKHALIHVHVYATYVRVYSLKVTLTGFNLHV